MFALCLRRNDGTEMCLFLSVQAEAAACHFIVGLPIKGSEVYFTCGLHSYLLTMEWFKCFLHYVPHTPDWTLVLIGPSGPIVQDHDTILLATSLISLPISNSRISVPFLWHCKNTKEGTILHTAATYIIVYIPGKHLTHQDTQSVIQTARKEKDLKIF